MARMTQAEYARHRGVSRPAINQAIGRGRIALENDNKIDPIKADAAMGSVNASADLIKSKAKVEHFKALQAEVNYLKSVEKLVHVDIVTESMERCAEMMVRDMEQFPAHADEIAALAVEGGAKAVKKKLKALIYDLRQTMADNLVILGKTEPEKDDHVAGHGAAAGSGKSTHARYRTA